MLDYFYLYFRLQLANGKWQLGNGSIGAIGAIAIVILNLVLFFVCFKLEEFSFIFLPPFLLLKLVLFQLRRERVLLLDYC